MKGARIAVTKCSVVGLQTVVNQTCLSCSSKNDIPVLRHFASLARFHTKKAAANDAASQEWQATRDENANYFFAIAP